MIAVGEVLAAVGARPRPRPRRMPASDLVDRQRHADRAGLGDGDRRGLEAERLGGGARCIASASRIALLAGGGVGVAGVDDRGARIGRRVAALAADPDRRRGGGVAGQQQRRGDLAPSRRRRRRRRCCRSPFSPQATRRRPGSRARAAAGSSSSTPAGGSTQRERKKPGPSALTVQAGLRLRRGPSIRLRFWTAWPAAPFQRLSIAAKARTRPRSSTVTWIVAPFVSRTSRTPGGRSTARRTARRA